MSVKVPENASLDILGHGWECKRGYKSTGTGCTKVNVPENARLNVLGHSWECNDGFKTFGSGCIPMTATEKEAQRLLKKKLLASYLAGHRSYSVTGYCDGEYVSGSVDGYKGSRNVSGSLEYDSGQSVYFDGEWSGRGEIEGSDEFGNSCDLEVD